MIDFELQNILVVFFGGWLISKVSTSIILELKMNNLKRELDDRIEAQLMKKMQPMMTLLGSQTEMKEQIQDQNVNVNNNIDLPSNSKPIYVG